ncbi:MAG: response regulator [Planctomycetota bacterium]
MLLVEDDADHRMICRHHLKKLKDRHSGVATAESLGEAREELAKQPVDLVLLDLTLPDSSLEETLDAIEELTRSHDARFVALSSLATDEVANRALKNGAAAFLPKQEMSADSLAELLDELRVAGPAAGAATAAEDASTPDPEKVAAGAPVEMDARTLASKITHDALSWAANISFRASALARDEHIQASEKLSGDVASIRESTDALTSFVGGARTLFVTELALAQLEGNAEFAPLDLADWLERTFQRWQRITRDKRLELSAETRSTAKVPTDAGERLLSQCLHSILENIPQHASRRSGPIAVRVAELAGTNSHAAIEITDDGGPWNVDDPATLGTALGTGVRKSSTAGLGLYTARRTLEALDGSLEINERPDAEGAYGIVLHLPRG